MSNELELIGREELQISHESEDLRAHINRLQMEKSDLLRNLENLTIEYDNCVRDITRDRQGMDSQNDWQTKLLITKIIFTNIELFQQARTQNAFTEMVEYARFDRNCHSKLSAFANVLLKLGHFR